MLRTLMIATALLATSGTALAHGGHTYGRVVSVEPHFSISFGSGHYDGFRVVYESGGHRYWTHSRYHPGHMVVLPSSHRHVKYVSHSHAHRGWDNRHGWSGPRDRGDRHDWRHERRDHRGDHRRGHGSRY